MMTIYMLKDLPESKYDRAGGKAKGLSKLIRAGLKVAPGFVIIGLNEQKDFSAAVDFYKKSGLGKVAVRSSATAEDGVDFSAAGQYATVLNVEGEDEFEAALKSCIDSLNSETAKSYSGFFADAKSREMSIVVQKMVEASAAGVSFTCDPVTMQKSVLIEAVQGLGEALVSGYARSESYCFPIIEADGQEKPDAAAATAGGDILGRDTALDIAAQSLNAKRHFGVQLDLEWAISPTGEIVWLQARPITTLDEAGIDELDCKEFAEDMVFTTCNIGEMLPGAVTPLSLSTSVASIDNGLREMLVTAGAYKNLKELPKGACITSFSNHLFFKLTAIYKMAVSIVGANKSDVEASICGKKLDTPDLPWPKQATLRRAFNAIGYFKFLLSRNKARKKIDKTVDKIKIEPCDDLAEFYDRIDKSLYLLDEATLYHYITSAHSGAMSSALLRILAGEEENDKEARELLAALLEDIDDIESVDILRSMRRLAQEVLKVRPDAAGMTAEELQAFIAADNGEVKSAYDAFISRHGHRAIREAELRSKSWEQDIAGLMENVLTVIKSGAEEGEKPASRLEENMAKALEGKKGALKTAVKYLAGQARAGVYNREYTKSRFVRAIDRFKVAYSALADRLVTAGALPDPDLIYFLSHEEIGDMIKNRRAKYVKVALRRRRLLDEQSKVRYKDVYIGKPEPIKAEELVCENGEVLTGAPISRGEVQGVARVVRSVDDAKKLQEGEIMVACFTDIGWSPYYSVIGGLITEVGSALSHGAVVAREYALPLVVNVDNATNRIKTGDIISLNGNCGTVTILETAEPISEPVAKSA